MFCTMHVCFLSVHTGRHWSSSATDLHFICRDRFSHLTWSSPLARSAGCWAPGCSLSLPQPWHWNYLGAAQHPAFTLRSKPRSLPWAIMLHTEPSPQLLASQLGEVRCESQRHGPPASGCIRVFLPHKPLAMDLREGLGTESHEKKPSLCLKNRQK